MSFFKQELRPERKPDGEYLALRRAALERQAGAYPDREGPVYAAVVDMDMERSAITLACAADGSADLYFSEGGGLAGLGEKYDVVEDAARNFLAEAARVLDLLIPADDFELPGNGGHCVYLLTDRGIFKQVYDITKMHTCRRELHYLYSLYQKVLKAMDDIQKLRRKKKK